MRSDEFLNPPENLTKLFADKIRHLVQFRRCICSISNVTRNKIYARINLLTCSWEPRLKNLMAGTKLRYYD